MTPTVRLAEELIARPSVTPDDAGCLDLIAARLAPLGFACERMDRGEGAARVSNLWARRAPARAPAGPAAIDSVADAASVAGGAAAGSAPLLAFAGHTDVVPPGAVAQWNSLPFVPYQRDRKLFGRGVADMKTSIAAFVVALEEYLAAAPDTPLALALLLTSDEEGPATHGTVAVCEALAARGERVDWCIVGEPTAVERTGDMVKNGRRGSLSARLTVRGVQGHVAYPHLARNPIHQVLPALQALAATEWDSGNEFFPATTWQVSNIHGGTGAGNVIPGEVVIDFNFRFSSESTAEALQQRVDDILNRHALEYDLRWSLSGQPFLTRPGALLDAVRAAIRDETGLETTLSTTGGTSDGRFIAPMLGAQVVECGPPNATIHKIDEHLRLADIEPLTAIYRRTMEHLAAHVAAGGAR